MCFASRRANSWSRNLKAGTNRDRSRRVLSLIASTVNFGVSRNFGKEPFVQPQICAFETALNQLACHRTCGPRLRCGTDLCMFVERTSRSMSWTRRRKRRAAAGGTSSSTRSPTRRASPSKNITCRQSGTGERGSLAGLGWAGSSFLCSCWPSSTQNVEIFSHKCRNTNKTECSYLVIHGSENVQLLSRLGSHKPLLVPERIKLQLT